jgi:hypothetical protein
MGQWRVLVAETITGTIVADIGPRDLPSFSRHLTDKGSWTVNVLPEDKANASLDLHAYTASGRYCWVVAYDEFIVQAGPVRTFQWDDSTRNLSVAGCGIQGLFDVRIVRNPTGTIAAMADASNDLVITGVSLRGVARRIVGANIEQPGYYLPLDLPASESGTNTRTYQGYDLATAWTRLDELSKVENGPELDFRPYFAGANRIRWEMLIGNPLLGDQNSNAVWDYGGALGQINVDVNGSVAPTTRAFAKGSGSERDSLIGYAENAAPIALGFPPTDFVNNDHSAVTVLDTLTGYAKADLTAFAGPTETWTCAVRIDGTTTTGAAVSPALGFWALGDQPVFAMSGHPWITDGSYRRRILGYTDGATGGTSSAGSDAIVNLIVQPTVEVI